MSRPTGHGARRDYKQIVRRKQQYRHRRRPKMHNSKNTGYTATYTTLQTGGIITTQQTHCDCCVKGLRSDYDRTAIAMQSGCFRKRIPFSTCFYRVAANATQEKQYTNTKCYVYCFFHCLPAFSVKGTSVYQVSLPSTTSSIRCRTLGHA